MVGLHKIIKLKLGESEKDVLVGEYINKVDIREKALCNLCVDYVDYGKQGF